jgi:two-component system chemotaxis sensor kinase CheA
MDALDIDREAVLKTFVAECEESFYGAESALVALERSPDDRSLVEVVFRAMHTLKGNAFSLGFTAVSEFAHAVEDVLDGIRSGRATPTPPLVTLLLSALDALREMLPEAIAGEDALAPAHAELAARLRRAASEGIEALASEGASSAGAAERRQRPFGRRTEDWTAWTERGRTLRVDATKLDRMLDLTGEITIALGRLRQRLQTHAGAARADLLELHAEAESLHLALQEQVLGVRMVPIGPTFRQLVRVVRDVAAACGKLARLEIEGEDVGVDMTVVEHLRDPLAHMIRNAIDHGIEAPERRRAAGKDPCGVVHLRARHDAGSLVVEIEDDGAGFRRERIAARAREHGIVPEPERLSSDELHRLVFQPGFSTAEAVTDMSGRGVGLDVALRNIESLRGTIRISSTPGAGTRFTIRLPLTMAIIDGFGVGAGGETFVLPLDAVTECLELPAEERASAAASGLLNVRGEALPYVRLCEVMGLPRERDVVRENVVVVRHENERAGIAVDRLYGESQTVIKPLGWLLRDLPGISGAAILGTGRVALILDVPTILRRVVAPPASRHVAA